MEYTIRSLEADDTFALLEVINKIGVDNIVKWINSLNVQKIIAEARNGGKVDEEQVGMRVGADAIKMVMTHLPACKEELYVFMSGLTGLKVAEIRHAPAVEFMQMLKDVISIEGFGDFFTGVFALLR